LESACGRALSLRALSYKTIESILKTGSEKLPLRKKATTPELPLFHDNIRGAGYYH
jgi:hypothetical protein